MTRTVGCLLGSLLLTSCESAAARRSGPIPNISVVRTWKDLLGQASVEAGRGVQARFGIENGTGPTGSGVLVYCLTEGFPPSTEVSGGNRLGPLRIIIAPGDAPEPEIYEAESHWESLRGKDAASSVVLRVHALHIERPVAYRITFVADDGRPVARATILGTSESFQPWLPWRSEWGFGTRNVPEESVSNAFDGPALPSWDCSTLFHGRREDAMARQHERLPTLVPERPDSGFTHRIAEGRLSLVSDVELPILRPDLQLLTRWWVNGKPFLPSEYNGGYISAQNGAIDRVRTLDLRLLFNPSLLGAKTGDRIELQTLYCEAWNWVTNDLGFRNPGLTESPPLLLLSNRAAFVVP